jgi:hypothetical protein
MRQPIHGFNWATDAGEASIGFASGRTEKEAKSRLKRRYKLSESEMQTVFRRTYNE